jgi:hypothetical protein
MANKMVTGIVLVAIAMWSFGFLAWIPNSEAAALTSVSDTLSDSDTGGTVSNHTIVFSNPTAIAETETIVVSFAAEFNLSTSTATLGLEDFDFATTSDYVLGYACGAGVNVSVATNTPTTQDITFTVCAGEGGAIPAGGTTTIQIGTNATSSGTGNNQIINPVEAGSYAITLGGSMTDSGGTLVAIIDDVVVTASVDTTFVFTINGMPAGYQVNGSPTTTATSTTATALPFGSITPGPSGSRTLAQNLTVTTNAANGFVVTVSTDGDLISSTGADIDSFANGGASSTPAAWEGPVGYLDSEQTWGHWGVTSEDSTFVGDADTFGTDFWVGDFIGTSTRAVFYHDGPADGVTTDQGSTTVGYQIEITAFQEAGSDYTANLTYVATPTF